MTHAQPKTNASRGPVVSLALYKAQRRRAVLAAQANARRRCVMNCAITLLMTAGFIATGYALKQEQRIQQVEQLERAGW